MLTITLYTDELLHDIRMKSSIECQAIDNAEERYRCEAGTDKNDELVRQMLTVSSSITRMFNKWLSNSQTSADNTLGKPESFQYALNLPERQARGKAQELTDACHAYMVSYVLARYYAGVGQKEWSNNYSLETAAHADEIMMIINRKAEPTI